jgi:hypothetical protein
MALRIDFPLGTSSHIAIFDDFLHEVDCEEIIKLSKSIWDDAFLDGKTVHGNMPDVKKTKDWTLNNFENISAPEETKSVAQELDDRVYRQLGSAVNLYTASFDAFLTLKSGLIDTGYLVQVYAGGEGFYREHIDGAPWLDGDLSDRILACVIYLNDIEVGGETMFPLHDFSVKPKAGRMVMFPATWTHPHIANVPRSSDKWIISTFLYTTNS